MKRNGITCLLALTMSLPAWALTLDEARQSGRVGETLSGYIAPRADDSDTLALVKRINDGRAAQYQRLAEQNNLITDEVARIAGQKLVNRAAAGNMYAASTDSGSGNSRATTLYGRHKKTGLSPVFQIRSANQAATMCLIASFASAVAFVATSGP